MPTQITAPDAQQRRRARRVFRTVSEVVALGALYALFGSVTHLYLPCVFRLLTGLQCPGCGITHCFLCLLRGDPAGAFRANAFVLCLLPAAVLYGAYRAACYIRTGREDYTPAETAGMAIVTAAAIAFAVIRNC